MLIDSRLEFAGQSLDVLLGVRGMAVGFSLECSLDRRYMSIGVSLDSRWICPGHSLDLGYMFVACLLESSSVLRCMVVEVSLDLRYFSVGLSLAARRMFAGSVWGRR